jgi:hypothetical protein
MIPNTGGGWAAPGAGVRSLAKKKNNNNINFDGNNSSELHFTISSVRIVNPDIQKITAIRI